PFPLSIVKRRTAMNEQLSWRCPMPLGVFRDHKSNEFLGRPFRQVILFAIRTPPRSHRASKNHTVARVEEHLRAATCVRTPGARRVLLEYKSDIADTFANRG